MLPGRCLLGKPSASHGKGGVSGAHVLGTCRRVENVSTGISDRGHRLTAHRDQSFRVYYHNRLRYSLSCLPSMETFALNRGQYTGSHGVRLARRTRCKGTKYGYTSELVYNQGVVIAGHLVKCVRSIGPWALGTYLAARNASATGRTDMPSSIKANPTSFTYPDMQGRKAAELMQGAPSLVPKLYGTYCTVHMQYLSTSLALKYSSEVTLLSSSSAGSTAPLAWAWPFDQT